MDIYLKVTAGVLITAILCLVLSRHRADISLLLAICVCCMVALAAVSYLQPVLALANKLVQMGQLSSELLRALFKVSGIGLISQIACLICVDADNQSLGKVLQILTTAVVLSICVPLLDEILSLLETALGEI